MIADSDIQQDYHSLLGFNGQLALSADQVQWRGMRFSQVKSNITNQQGLLTVKQLEGSLGEGRLSLPGMLDVRGNTSHAAFQPQLDNVEIGTILQAFNYPINLTGKLSLKGDFWGRALMQKTSVATGRDRHSCR